MNPEYIRNHDYNESMIINCNIIDCLYAVYQYNKHDSYAPFIRRFEADFMYGVYRLCFLRNDINTLRKIFKDRQYIHEFVHWYASGIEIAKYYVKDILPYAKIVNGDAYINYPTDFTSPMYQLYTAHNVGWYNIHDRDVFAQLMNEHPDILAKHIRGTIYTKDIPSNEFRDACKEFDMTDNNSRIQAIIREGYEPDPLDLIIAEEYINFMMVVREREEVHLDTWLMCGLPISQPTINNINKYPHLKRIMNNYNVTIKDNYCEWKIYTDRMRRD